MTAFAILRDESPVFPDHCQGGTDALTAFLERSIDHDRGLSATNWHIGQPFGHFPLVFGICNTDSQICTTAMSCAVGAPCLPTERLLSVIESCSCPTCPNPSTALPARAGQTAEGA